MHTVSGAFAAVDGPLNPRCLRDITVRHALISVSGGEVSIRGGVLTVIGCSGTRARPLIGRRLGPVALRRMLVAVGGGVLTTVGGATTQARAHIRRRLRPVALGRSRLAQLSRPLPVQGSMTPAPPTLVELRCLRIRFNARLDVDRRSIVALVGRGIRPGPGVFISLGQVGPGHTCLSGSLLLGPVPQTSSDTSKR